MQEKARPRVLARGLLSLESVATTTADWMPNWALVHEATDGFEVDIFHLFRLGAFSCRERIPFGCSFEVLFQCYGHNLTLLLRERIPQNTKLPLRTVLYF